MCVVVVGVGVTALMQSLGSATQANVAAVNSGVALQLARTAYEWADTQSFTSLQTLKTTPKVASPVIDAQGKTMANFAGWAQQISATSVSEDSLTTQVAGASNALRVTVTVLRGTKPVCTLNWLKFSN